MQAEFAQYFPGEPRFFWAPGRVNLIGEHTDYNDGFVMPAAIHLGCSVAAAPRSDGVLALYSRQLADKVELKLSELAPRGHWSDYPAGVAAVLREGGLPLDGASLYLDSTVPAGAGLSSSAALEVAVGFALLSLAGREIDLTRLALDCQQAEHRFPGTKCGIMDQFISCHGRAGQSLMLDCRDLFFAYAPLPPEVKLVICNSGVHHSLASGAYNERRAACAEACELLGVSSLRDATLEQVATLPPDLECRARHVVSENARVLAFRDALERGNLSEAGRQMAGSHASLRDDYEVSCSELDALVELAAKHPSTVGARMTGGGFGGCTVNLVRSEGLQDFRAKLSQLAPEIYVTVPSDGAHEVIHASH